MAKEVRLGRQTPTQSYILPYTKSYGWQAIEIYSRTGRTAQEWQELLLYDILAENDDCLWVHTKFGYSIPRRNGKNEVIAMRELWGLQHGENILHTAHRTTTSHSAWERLCDLLDSASILYKSIKATGRENIRLKTGGGRIEFRTRSPKGGLGEGFDLLVIDEAQEYTYDQESALKYVVSDSPNPQTIFCGTPPTPASSGTVFLNLRASTLQGRAQNTGWAEWSVPEQSNPEDRDLWYETNPSMGTILTERKIADEIGRDAVDFNIQRLGLWLRYNQKSAISKAEWEMLKCDRLPELTGKLFVGIKYCKDGSGVAMSLAVKTADQRILVESRDYRDMRAGNTWIIEFLREADVAAVAVDGANGQAILAKEMRAARLKAPILPTVRQVIEANAMFEQALYARTICHMGQPALAQAVSNCEKRAIGTSGGFGYNPQISGIKIELLDSVALAHWLCAEHKEERRQRVSY